MFNNIKELTEEEYHEHCNEYNGLCIKCGEINYGFTEPDAREYDCDECGEKTVMGIEEALLMGYIRVV